MASETAADTTLKTPRVASIDILRGIVMVIMALDHVREYFHKDALLFDPLDLEQTNLALYATRWVTHFCAPVFVLLAGSSAFLQGARGKSKGQLSLFLLTRGLWLLLLEVTVIGFGWNFRVDFIFLQVIWAIACSMIVLAALVWLNWRIVLAIGLAIIAGHNLLDPIKPAAYGAFAPVMAVLHTQQPILMGDKLIGFMVYPLLPWIGLMAVGYGLGAAFLQPERRRHLILWLTGLGLLALFAALRLTQAYGEANGWESQIDAARTAMDFMNVTKYPPSLLYVCATIGPALILLPFLEKLKGQWAEPWATFGAVPFFFYVLHIYLAHGLSALIAINAGHRVWGVMDVFTNPAVIRGPDFSLAGTYVVWALVVGALYLPCKWFAEVKRNNPSRFLSYL